MKKEIGKHDAAFKAKVVFEVIRGQKTLSCVVLSTCESYTLVK